jgi:penicillin-binding protein 1A
LEENVDFLGGIVRVTALFMAAILIPFGSIVAAGLILVYGGIFLHRVHRKVDPLLQRVEAFCIPYLHMFWGFLCAIWSVSGRQAVRLNRALRPLPWVRWPLYGAALSCSLVLAVGAYFLWYIHLDQSDSPNAELILNWEPPQIAYLYDRNNLVAMRAANQYRDVVAFPAIPLRIQQALLAAEDSSFYSHSGWDASATLRAAVKGVGAKVFGLSFREQGASTITQQTVRKIDPALADWDAREEQSQLLVDNLATRVASRLIGPVATNRVSRKLREIKYAVRVEKQLTAYFRAHPPATDSWLARVSGWNARRHAKQLLLTRYTNLPFLGHGVYGMAYGAEFYFGKKLEDLDAAEAAFLVSLFPNPSSYGRLVDNPADVAGKKVRRDEVLRRMAENGFLSQEELAQEKAKPVQLNVKFLKAKTEAPAVINAVVDEMRQAGFSQDQLNRGDVQIKLSFDLNVQRAVNTAVWRNLQGEPEKKYDGFKQKYPDAPEPQVAVVVLANRDAAVLAQYGVIAENLRNNYTGYNRATRSLRQPGSTFKGIDTVAAVMNGVQPDDLVLDAPVCISKGWGRGVHCIGNYDGKFHGQEPLREAIARSHNTAFLRLMKDTVGSTEQARRRADTLKIKSPGAAEVIHWARVLGIRSHLEPYITTVLGASGVTPLEMANAYRGIASGVSAEPYVITQISDRRQQVAYAHQDTTRPLGIPPEKLELVHELLRGTVRLPSGTSHRSLESSNFPIQVMAKTGTSNDHRDAMFAASTYGLEGITIFVWVGYDNFSQTLPHQGLPMFERASGGRVALPIARDIFLSCYGEGKPLGEPPQMPEVIEQRIDAYLEKAYPKQANK